MPDVFSELERDWGAFSRSKAGTAALARWGLDEPALADFDDLSRLATAAQGVGEVDLERRDQLQFALLRCARRDSDARYTMLAILRPGLGRVARRSRAQWGFEETAAATVDLALEAIIAYPEGRSRPATCILRHVSHELWLQQWRERRMNSRLGRATLLDEEELMPVTQRVSPGEEVLDLVGEAVRAGKVSVEHGRLVVLHRVLGVPTSEVAAELGRPAGTVRQQRSRAEAVIARFALRAVA